MATVAWSTAMLDLLKAPKTPANYAFLNSWSLREQPTSMLSDSHNPFMTTAGTAFTLGPFKAGTFPKWNNIGVAKYPNLETGVYVNALHISSEYPNIAAAVRSGNPTGYRGSIKGPHGSSVQSELLAWSGSGYASVMGTGGAAGPTGPTVDTSRFSGVLKGAAFPSSSGGVGGAVSSVASAVNDAARHVPGVAQAEGVAGAAVDVGTFLGKLTDPAYILRGLQIVAGGGLVAIGAVLLARQVALAADLPDPVAFAGPVGRAATVAAGAAAAQTPSRREGRRIEDAADSTRPAREGVRRRTETVDADTGMTRAQVREARQARRASSAGPTDDIPF